MSNEQKTAEAEALNPKVRELTIGIRKFRTVQFYPLSVMSESQMTDALNELLGKVRGDDGQTPMTDMQLTNEIIVTIKTNLGRILGYATDEDGDAMLGEMDNDQFLDALDIIFEQNFAGALKKGRSLFDKIKPMFLKEQPSKRPQPLSAKSMDTGSMKSTDNIFDEEVLPAGK